MTLDQSQVGAKPVKLTMYVWTTKKKSSSTGTENKVGPMTASGGYAFQLVSIVLYTTNNSLIYVLHIWFLTR